LNNDSMNFKRIKTTLFDSGKNLNSNLSAESLKIILDLISYV
jgi:hypothetical protein